MRWTAIQISINKYKIKGKHSTLLEPVTKKINAQQKNFFGLFTIFLFSFFFFFIIFGTVAIWSCLFNAVSLTAPYTCEGKLRDHNKGYRTIKPCGVYYITPCLKQL